MSERESVLSVAFGCRFFSRSTDRSFIRRATAKQRPEDPLCLKNDKCDALAIRSGVKIHCENRTNGLEGTKRTKQSEQDP